jgi:hypothetical protein
MTPPTPTVEEAHALAVEAKAAAAEANGKADQALAAADRAENAVAGLAHDVRRCANEVADLKRQGTENHAETMAAINGAKVAVAAREKADTLHDTQIATLTTEVSKISTRDAAKGGALAIAVGAVLLSLSRMMDACSPVLPELARHYAAPTTTSAPATSAPPPLPTP